MNLEQEINKIIKRRKEKVPAIEVKFREIQEITQRLNDIESKHNDTLQTNNGDLFSDDIWENIEKYRSKFNAVEKKYQEIISRFSKDEINIAVVGNARQGKSRFLQSISSLNDNIIPAFASDDCTGASSVIRNVPGQEGVKAEITFMTETEMIQCIQKYLDRIYGEDKKKITSFREIGNLPLDSLENEMPEGSPNVTYFEHLKKYVKHFKEWSVLVNEGKKVITEPKEIQQYVAQHNDKEEEEIGREDYYNYLAVKDVVISCQFQNPETGKIVIRDTIGLGDTSLGIEDKMLNAIGNHSDAAIIVSRPEASTGKFSDSDNKMYQKLYDEFEKKNMDKWLFWMINRTSVSSTYGDNNGRCEAFKKKVDEKKWKIADCFIADVSDVEMINDIFKDKVLTTLVDNIDDIDDGILVQLNDSTKELYGELRKIQQSIASILMNEVSRMDKSEFIASRWKDVYERGFMKLAKEFRNELESLVDEECTEFRNKIEEILAKAPQEIVPTVKELQEDLDAGGNNRPFEVYAHYMDKVRNDFTEQFLGIDNFIFNEKTIDFKAKLVNIFAEDVKNGGGGLKYILPKPEKEKSDEWLREIAQKIFNKDSYVQFKTAFLTVADFQFSVRGFLMHRIRARLDKLNAMSYQTNEQNNKDIADEIRRIIENKLKKVSEEIIATMNQDGFYKDPNKILYAAMAEFYDRTNYSYTEKTFEDAEDVWKRIYTEHCHEVWEDEFRESDRVSELYKYWETQKKILAQYTEENFCFSI